MEMYILAAVFIVAGASYLVFAEHDAESPERSFRANQIAANICEVLQSPVWRRLFESLTGNTFLLTAIAAAGGTAVAWWLGAILYAQMGGIAAGFALFASAFEFCMSRPKRRR
jgi:hypothetical protein